MLLEKNVSLVTVSATHAEDGIHLPRFSGNVMCCAGAALADFTACEALFVGQLQN